jgi:hypothetical protein
VDQEAADELVGVERHQLVASLASDRSLKRSRSTANTV